MPQFDLTWYASQAFWVILTFATMFLIVAGYAVPKIVGVMRERDDKIQGDLQKAEHLKAEAAHILAEYQKAIASAQDNSRKMIAEAHAATAAMLKEKEKEFSDSLNKKLLESENILKAERQQALAEMTSLTQNVTREIVQKLIGESVDVAELESKVVSAMEKPTC